MQSSRVLGTRLPSPTWTDLSAIIDGRSAAVQRSEVTPAAAPPAVVFPRASALPPSDEAVGAGATDDDDDCAEDEDFDQLEALEREVEAQHLRLIAGGLLPSQPTDNAE